FLFRSVAKKGRESWNNAKRQTTAAQPAATKPKRVAPIPQVKPWQPTTSGSLSSSQLTSMEEGRSNYSPIRSSLETNRMDIEGTGSLGGATKEGAPSTEGMSSMQREPGASYIVGPADYRSAQPAETSRILPLEWDGNALVRAVVMNEILNRPQGWSQDNG
ncbi:MAG: hypothetical protein GX418_14980, partial [Clostridiales bacterium]|nr:hypothetical protein [Clostridiales bacterium]